MLRRSHASGLYHSSNSPTGDNMHEELNELEGLMDSWMTRSPGKGGGAGGGGGAAAAVSKLNVQTAAASSFSHQQHHQKGKGPSSSSGLLSSPYKSPRSSMYYSDHDPPTYEEVDEDDDDPTYLSGYDTSPNKPRGGQNGSGGYLGSNSIHPATRKSHEGSVRPSGAAAPLGGLGSRHHDEGGEDIANYVVSKVSGRPVKLPPVRSMMAQGKTRKVYGYQEPASLMRKSAKQQRAAENNMMGGGGAARGPLSYDDPSSRDIRDPGFGRSKFQREVDRHTKTGWNERPSAGIPTLNELPPTKRTRSTGRSTAPTTIGRSRLPAPGKLPPLNPSDLRQPSTAGGNGGTRNQRAAFNQYNGRSLQRKPLTAGAATAASSRNRSTGAAANRGTTGGILSSLSPRGVKPMVNLDPRVELEKALVDKTALLEKAAVERSQRSNLMKRSSILAEDIEGTQSECTQLQADAKKLDVQVKKLQGKAQQATKQAHALRQKQKQLKELKTMHRVATQRLDAMTQEELQGDAPMIMLSAEAPVDVDAQRKNNRQYESLREKYNELLAVRNDFISEISRLEAKDKERLKSTNDMVTKLEREKQLAKLELERKATAELQKEISRIRENFEKVQRHRQREIKAKTDEISGEASQLKNKIQSMESNGMNQSKELAAMGIKVATSKQILEDISKEISKLDSQIQAVESGNERLTLRAKTIGRDQTTAAKELEVLKDQPTTTVAPLEAQASLERKKLNEESSGVASKQKQLLAEISRAEDDIERATSELVQLQKSTNNPSSSSSGKKDDLTSVEASIAEMKKEISRVKSETKSLLEKYEKDSKAKDSIIEQKTRAVGSSKSKHGRLNDENTDLLEKLDALERMANLNGVTI